MHSLFFILPNYPVCEHGLLPVYLKGRWNWYEKCSQTVIWLFLLQSAVLTDLFPLLQESGLSTWLGNQLSPLEKIPAPAIAVVMCLLVATFTECTSNVATTTLFLPILASMVSSSISKYSYKGSFKFLFKHTSAPLQKLSVWHSQALIPLRNTRFKSYMCLCEHLSVHTHSA